MEIDLITDWYNELIKQMKNLKLNFDEKQSKSILIIEYFNFLRKRDSGRKWKICKSKEFYCPSEYEVPLKNIAITGGFGAGKTTIIDAYLNNQSEKTKK